MHTHLHAHVRIYTYTHTQTHTMEMFKVLWGNHSLVINKLINAAFLFKLLFLFKIFSCSVLILFFSLPQLLPDSLHLLIQFFPSLSKRNMKKTTKPKNKIPKQKKSTKTRSYLCHPTSPEHMEPAMECR